MVINRPDPRPIAEPLAPGRVPAAGYPAAIFPEVTARAEGRAVPVPRPGNAWAGGPGHERGALSLDCRADPEPCRHPGTGAEPAPSLAACLSRARRGADVIGQITRVGREGCLRDRRAMRARPHRARPQHQLTGW